MVLIGLGIFNFNTEVAFAPTAQAQYTSPLTVKATTTDNTIACNCYSFVRSEIPDLPLMQDIVPNAPAAVGRIVVMDYHGVPHIAIITKLTNEGVLVEESNYHHCQFDTRLIAWDDKALRGFYEVK